MSHDDVLLDLKEKIAGMGSLLVSYSGGVDSSLLAYLAHLALGNRALCVMLSGPLIPNSELIGARDLAGSLGLNLQVAEFSILDDGRFRQNPANRCYICKKSSAALLRRIAFENGIDCIADGVNLDDLGDYRPGLRACEEEGVWHPFVDAGIGKAQIRSLAKNIGLSVWNKPSLACLASRIAYGEPIDEEKLLMIERAEEHLAELGFSQRRVRMQGLSARIELEKSELDRAVVMGDGIAKRLREIGFLSVSLDLEGYRSGSMNEELWTREQ